jgi:hypothetical protein
MRSEASFSSFYSSYLSKTALFSVIGRTNPSSAYASNGFSGVRSLKTGLFSDCEGGSR